jgi:hypothetical protein
MQHRRPAEDCPLCPLWGVAWDDADTTTHRKQHAVAEELWAAWDGSTGWEQRVQQVAAVHGVTASAEQIKRHFSSHRIEQPYLSRRPAKPLVLAEISQLPERARALLTATYRQRMLTREQAIEVFFAGSHRTRKAAEVEADRLLTHLARRHFLYRWYPPKTWPKTLRSPSAEFLRSVSYFAGRGLQPWAEEQNAGPVWPENFVGLARQVGLATLQHDVACSQLYVDLVKAIRVRGGTLELPDRGVLECSAPVANWYGSRQVRFVFYDERRSCDVDMKPDGFATLALGRSSYAEGALPPCQLPFFYEVDRGTKGEIEVAQQMLDYHRLAISSAVGDRFPELDVPGYAVPLIMLFPDRKRLETVVRSFLRQAAKEHLQTGAPILVGVNGEWAADPFSIELVHAWDGRTFSLLDALLRSSRRLREVGALLPRDVLSYAYKTQVRRELRRSPDLTDLPPETAIVGKDHDSESAAETDPATPPVRVSPAAFAGLYGDREESSGKSLPEWAEPSSEPTESEPAFDLPEAPEEVTPKTVEEAPEEVGSEPVAPRPAPVKPKAAKAAPLTAEPPKSKPAKSAPASTEPVAAKPSRRRRSADTGWGDLLG